MKKKDKYNIRLILKAYGVSFLIVGCGAYIAWGIQGLVGALCWAILFSTLGIIHNIANKNLLWYHNIINWLHLPIAWYVLRRVLKKRVTFEARKSLMQVWHIRALEKPTKLRRPYFLLHTWGVKYYVKEQAKLIKKITKAREKK